MLEIKLEELDDWNLRYLTNEILDKCPDDMFARPVTVFVVPAADRKSLPQLRYYWGVVLEDIADQTGYWPEEIHEYNKKLFSVKSTFFVDGEALEIVRGMSKFKKKEMADFITKVIEFWTGKGVIIRDPDNLSDLEYVQALNTEVDE